MSTKAEIVLEQLRSLSPEEQREIVQSWQQQPENAQTSQPQTWRHGRGLLAGSGLLDALLADRTKERARG